jgi:hypothetical protein
MYCNLCNKNIKDKNIIKHCKSKTHNNNEIKKLYCFNCKKKYSNNKTFNKHKINCKFNTNNIIDNYNKIKNDNNKIDSINNNVIIVKEDIKNVKANVDKALNKASSIIKYLMQYFPDVPSIKKIDKKILKDELKLKYEYDESSFINKKDKYEYFDNKLEIILLDDFKRNIFIKNICKTILNYINYKDPNKQPIYSTDTSRCNYIIKINTKWNNDINGNKLKEYVIEPILYTIEKLMKKYRIKQEIKKNKNIDLLLEIYRFEQNIHNNLFIKPILKELSSHLKFDNIINDDNNNNNDDDTSSYSYESELESVESIESVESVESIESEYSIESDNDDDDEDYSDIYTIEYN